MTPPTRVARYDEGAVDRLLHDLHAVFDRHPTASAPERLIAATALLTTVVRANLDMMEPWDRSAMKQDTLNTLREMVALIEAIDCPPAMEL